MQLIPVALMLNGGGGLVHESTTVGALDSLE